jgi:hypothetical protein
MRAHQRPAAQHEHDRQRHEFAEAQISRIDH